MTQGDRSATLRRGLNFIGFFVLGALLGLGLVLVLDLTRGTAVAAGLALPGAMLLGYGIWHARRIARTIRLVLGGARKVPDDPVAERAAGAFTTAGVIVALGMLVVGLFGGVLLRCGMVALLTIVWARVLGRAARDGRLPAPEFE